MHGHQPQDTPCEAFNENPHRATVIPVVSAPFPTTLFPFSSFFNLSQYSTKAQPLLFSSDILWFFLCELANLKNVAW